MEKIKAYFFIAIGTFIIFSCSDEYLHIRKIPCEDISTYNNQGNLNGTYLTQYYAVDARFVDSAQILTAIHKKADFVFQETEKFKYSRVTCYFLKASEKLEKIRNCEVTDSHNVNSSEHQSILVLYKDRQQE